MTFVTVPIEHGVGAACFRDDLVVAAADELGAHLIGDELRQREERRVVLERRDADRPDVVGQKIATPGQRVSATARRQRAR